MNKIKVTLLAFAVMAISLNTTAQKFEAGIFAGGANYLGDLIPILFSPGNIRPALGFVGRINYTEKQATRVNLLYGRITAKPNSHNLSFSSNIFEFSAQQEYSLPVFKGLRPYGFIGLGVFHHNPKAKYNGGWHALQPLGTEGQGTSAFTDREPYKLTQVVIPIGAGIKIYPSKGLCIGIEGSMRKTFTDYLDDVSSTYVDLELLSSENGQLAASLSNRTGEVGEPRTWGSEKTRGNPNGYDWYGFLGITITKVFSDYMTVGGDGIFRKKGKAHSCTFQSKSFFGKLNPLKCFNFIGKKKK